MSDWEYTNTLEDKLHRNVTKLTYRKEKIWLIKEITMRSWVSAKMPDDADIEKAHIEN